MEIRKFVVWGLFDATKKEIAQFDYHDRPKADQVCALLNQKESAKLPNVNLRKVTRQSYHVAKSVVEMAVEQVS